MKTSKKTLRQREAIDRRSRMLDKLGIHNSHFELRRENGELWAMNLPMPYPTGFPTKAGHWILRAWGFQGSALCGATISFDQDSIICGGKEKPVMRQCCQMRLLRMQARLGYRRLVRNTKHWCWYVPTEKLGGTK